MSGSRSADNFDIDAFVNREQLLGLLCDITGLGELVGEESLTGTPLTLPSSGLLITIDHRPGITIADLSRLIPKTQQTLGQIVSRLERLGLVERRLGAHRGVGLHTTDAGQAMARQAIDAERETEARLRDILGERSAASLTRLLRTARTALLEAR